VGSVGACDGVDKEDDEMGDDSIVLFEFELIIQINDIFYVYFFPKHVFCHKGLD
jgi:hypothetical protein